MKCKNKEFQIDGIVNSPLGLNAQKLHVIITNDEHGKTISIDNGTLQYTINADEISKYLK